MRVTDIFLAVPALLLALALAAVLLRAPSARFIAITVSWWPWYARLARGEAASVSRRRYVETGRVLGLSRRRLMFSITCCRTRRPRCSCRPRSTSGVFC